MTGLYHHNALYTNCKMKDKSNFFQYKPGKSSDKENTDYPDNLNEDLSLYQEQLMLLNFTEEENVRLKEMGMKKPACAKRLTDTCTKIPDSES